MLWSVKGFVWHAVKDSPYKVGHEIRMVEIIGRDLTWKAAKKLRKENTRFQAFITKNVPHEELKILRLS